MAPCELEANLEAEMECAAARFAGAPDWVTEAEYAAARFAEAPDLVAEAECAAARFGGAPDWEKGSEEDWEEELESESGEELEEGWTAWGAPGADHRDWASEPKPKLGAKGKPRSRVYALAKAWSTSKIKLNAGRGGAQDSLCSQRFALRRPSSGSIEFDVAVARTVTGWQKREFEFGREEIGAGADCRSGAENDRSTRV